MFVIRFREGVRYMDKQKSLGQFFSSNAELIEDFKSKIDPKDILLDPFAGELDLLKQFSNQFEAYDIDPKLEVVKYNDSFMNPLDYSDRFVITNPPYLNINKTTNKDIFIKYDTDDLYKAALKTLIASASKGIIIIPSAFWFNERSQAIRKEFLSIFKVPKVIIFNQQMFKDTTYTVCSFYFERTTTESQNISFDIRGQRAGSVELVYSNKNNYSIQNDMKQLLKTYPKPIEIKRLRPGDMASTNIFLHCLDTTLPIRAVIDKPYVGKDTDRAFLTFVLNNETLTPEEEVKLVEIFNAELSFFREIFMDSFLSNYRNDGRKRIGFNLAYKLFEHALTILKEK